MPQQLRSPLSGIRVIDLSTTFMGPYCTALLAQWGAEVVKIEAPGGDVLRYIGDVKELGMGPVFLNANRGKRSVVLDLKTPGGRLVLDRLARDCDVLVHNLRPEAAARLEVTEERMMSLNDQLIYCSLRGFGAGGPYQHRAAYDDVIQAASGMAAVQGGGDGPPTYLRTSAADKIMGILGAAAVLAGLQGRQLDGRGRAIEVPMFESMASFMLLEQQGGMVFDPPDGPVGYPRTESPHRRPCRTKDGYLSVMLYTDEQWAAFFRAIGQPRLLDNPRYRTIRERTLHIDELYELVNAQMLQRDTAEWQQILGDADIATGPINTIEDLFEDEHLAATGFFESVEHPAIGKLKLARPPVVMGDRDTGRLRHAPRLGEHSIEVAGELGFDRQTITDLLQQRALIDVSDQTPATGEDARHG